MPGQPAARVGDPHVCPMVTGTVPHVGGPILPPGAPTVLVGGSPAARVGDMATCVGPPDTIAKGSFVVPIANQPAARMTDTTIHGGSIVMGCPTVLIGLAGVAGNVAAGRAMCQAAASGRTSGTTKQSYNNCGVESSRQVINQANGTSISEDSLLQQSINSGLANGTPGSPPTVPDGGTDPLTRQAILGANGVPSTVMQTTADNLGTALSQGRGVIVSMDAAPLWGGSTPAGSLHAVTVTGIEYDDNGNPTAVYINDTGTGRCGQRVPIATFNQATGAHPNSRLNVTTNPIF
jgi:uncharacterized Zn-binding protein involved in type VI secretion